MARTSTDSQQLPRPALLASVGLLAKLVPLSTVSAVLKAEGKNSQRERALPAHFLVYFIIALSLYMPYSLREVLRCVLDGLRALDSSLVIATKGAISRARTRLGWKVLAEIYRQVVHPIARADTRGAWYRQWRVVGLDGTTLALQCTQENVEEFGLHSSKEGPAAFPLLRLVALVEVGTHIVLKPAIGLLTEAETTLANQLLPSLSENMLLIEDRGYISYEWWKSVQSTGADILCRAKNNMRLSCSKRLADGSFISYLNPPKAAGKKVAVRVIEYKLKGVQGSVETYRIITTILNPEFAPAHELAALYHERWEVETLFDEFKTHVRGGSRVLLRSKTPDLVKQEVYGLLLAHYVVRVVMYDAAQAMGEDPDRISFTHTVRVLKRRIPQAGVFSPAGVDKMV